MVWIKAFLWVCWGLFTHLLRTLVTVNLLLDSSEAYRIETSRSPKLCHSITISDSEGSVLYAFKNMTQQGSGMKNTMHRNALINTFNSSTTFLEHQEVRSAAVKRLHRAYPACLYKNNEMHHIWMQELFCVNHHPNVVKSFRRHYSNEPTALNLRHY